MNNGLAFQSQSPTRSDRSLLLSSQVSSFLSFTSSHFLRGFQRCRLFVIARDSLCACSYVISRFVCTRIVEQTSLLCGSWHSDCSLLGTKRQPFKFSSDPVGNSRTSNSIAIHSVISLHRTGGRLAFPVDSGFSRYLPYWNPKEVKRTLSPSGALRETCKFKQHPKVLPFFGALLILPNWQGNWFDIGGTTRARQRKKRSIVGIFNNVYQQWRPTDCEGRWPVLPFYSVCLFLLDVFIFTTESRGPRSVACPRLIFAQQNPLGLTTFRMRIPRTVFVLF